MTSLMLEGGAALHRAVLDAGLVDRVQVYMTPTVAGTGGLAWPGCRPHRLAGLRRSTAPCRLGDDVLIEGVCSPD